MFETSIHKYKNGKFLAKVTIFFREGRPQFEARFILFNNLNHYQKLRIAKDLLRQNVYVVRDQVMDALIMTNPLVDVCEMSHYIKSLLENPPILKYGPPRYILHPDFESEYNKNLLKSRFKYA